MGRASIDQESLRELQRRHDEKFLREFVRGFEEGTNIAKSRPYDSDVKSIDGLRRHREQAPLSPYIGRNAETLAEISVRNWQYFDENFKNVVNTVYKNSKRKSLLNGERIISPDSSYFIGKCLGEFLGYWVFAPRMILYAYQGTKGELDGSLKGVLQTIKKLEEKIFYRTTSNVLKTWAAETKGMLKHLSEEEIKRRGEIIDIIKYY